MGGKVGIRDEKEEVDVGKGGEIRGGQESSRRREWGVKGEAQLIWKSLSKWELMELYN